jgi:hypothetical protein
MRSNRPATRVRLALEARVDGHPRGQQSLVEVGKEWRKYRLQVAPLPTEPLEQPHVRVEPLDRGELWIDDVELSVASLGADELRELTKTVSSIRLAWDEGRLSDCGRLLDGYWGRLLLDEPPAEPPREASKPRLGERMRGIFRR